MKKLVPRILSNSSITQPTNILTQSFVVLARGIGIDACDHGVRGNEAGDVVDVAVRVVTDNAGAKPDNILNAEKFGKDALVVALLHSRVPLLHATEQALFGGDQRTASVHVERSAFKDNVPVCERRLDFLCLSSLGHQASDLFVAPPVWIFCPGIESPFNR